MQIFKNYGFDLTEEENKKFKKLYELFSDWNSKINLSAIRDKEGIYLKHFVDSLLSMKFMDFENKKVLDIGAGGGFPTLPLAIVNSTAEFTALDSVGKKMKVVQKMADDLGLNVKTIHGRIEDFGQNKEYREQFDIVTARALAPWPVLLEYGLPFVKKGGVFLTYLGPQVHEDLMKYKKLEERLGGKIIEFYEDKLADAERYFVIIEKVKCTSKKYPRGNGVPRMTPLK